jgi:hypothetical protein
MWVPPSVIYLAAACLLFMAWMETLERTMQRTEGRLRPAPESLPVQATLDHPATATYVPIGGAAGQHTNGPPLRPQSQATSRTFEQEACSRVRLPRSVVGGGAKGGDDDAG